MVGSGITRFFNILRICEKCESDYVISYDIVYDPVLEDENVGTCDMCGRTAVLKVFKYVTVLDEKRLKRVKSLNTGGVFK